MFASFYAKSVTLEGDVLTFTGVSKDLTTSLGKTEVAKAFAPGRFPAGENAVQADGVITGKNAEGKTVTTVLRFVEPSFADDKLTVKVSPVAKDATPLLVDGYVTKALANPAYTPMSPDLKVCVGAGGRETQEPATRWSETPTLAHTLPLSRPRPPLTPTPPLCFFFFSHHPLTDRHADGGRRRRRLQGPAQEGGRAGRAGDPGPPPALRWQHCDWCGPRLRGLRRQLGLR